MASKSKAANAAAAIANNIPRMGYSVAEFCASHGISEGLYRKLRKDKIGPREGHLRRRVFITAEAAAEWRRAREQQ